MTASRLLRAVMAQGRTEVVLTLRRGESVLVTLVIPVALLAFFASARVLPQGGRGVDYLLPGTLALAIISTSLVSLGIATAYERYYGVLKRLGATPLPRSGLVAAKMLAVTGLEVVQVALLVAVGMIFFAWRPHGSFPLALLALLLGTLAFSGLGLTLAGTLRAEATLAGANGLFVLFLLIGGLFVPLDHLPAWLVPIAQLLPADALADVVRSVLRYAALPWKSAALLALWAAVLPLLAAATFRWE
ncbi:MAG TPA: ABC transporter permease [Chloroflexota bacterium]